MYINCLLSVGVQCEAWSHMHFPRSFIWCGQPRHCWWWHCSNFNTHWNHWDERAGDHRAGRLL